ncbi:MAG: YggT family protein [Deltaproteobacteria bacterium]|nr:YggT family protein [Deltaproteobacteria bacterium]
MATERVEHIHPVVPSREGVIARVGEDVEADVAARAAVAAPDEPERLDAVAEKIRGHALDDVRRSDRDQRAALVAGRIAQVVDYLFGLVYALLGARFVLELLAARRGAGFTRFVEAITDPVYAPFRNIVETLRVGDGRVVLSLAVALVAYAVLHLAIRGVLRMVASRRTTV